MDKVKNGNREGMSVLIQISIPAAAPLIPVRVSMIKVTKQSAAKKIVMDLRLFNVITSGESMRS